jgi:hypothetical protein
MISFYKLLFGLILILTLVGCGGLSSPAIYKQDNSETCSYNDIEGKTFKYISKEYFGNIIYDINSNLLSQNKKTNYNSILNNGFKVIKTGYKYNDAIYNAENNSVSTLGNKFYTHDRSYVTKVVTEDCKLYYVSCASVDDCRRIMRNYDNSILTNDDILSIIGKETLTLRKYDSDIEYDRFTKTYKIETPRLYNTFIRGNIANGKLQQAQIYVKLIFPDKWGFIDSAIDEHGKKYKVVKIATESDCSGSRCYLEEDIGIEIDLDFLKNNTEGIEIKVYGAREVILDIPSALIKSFLNAVNSLEDK